MSNITAVILTKNEEKNIVDCLETLAWAKEVIVLDDFSTDRTAEIARLKGATILKRDLGKDFSKQRNYALSKCKTEWVLFVDADERVTRELKEEIDGAIKMSGFLGFYIKRRDILWGKALRYGETGNAKFLRLAKRESGKWAGTVHERWVVNGKIRTLNNFLLHYPHQSVSEILKEINFYTDIRAVELRNSSINSSLFQIIFYPLGKFIVNYIFKLGFLDGERGIIISSMMSFHSFLVRGKLWLMLKKN